MWVRVPRGDARGFRASLSGWVGGIDAGDLGEGGGRGAGAGAGMVGCQWRVLGEGWGCLWDEGGGGMGLFG